MPPLYKKLRYSLNEMEEKSQPHSTRHSRYGGGWLVLLVLPYLGLCFPALYARNTPVLLGFPFFYWYQFAWVLATSALLGVVYLKLRQPE